MAGKAIADYALLSDRHSAALVARDGAVDWLCFPRFDSPSVFGALLDERAGSWALRPTGESTVSRRYLDATMVLETTFRTADGTVTVTDALATGVGDPHALGANAAHLLLRSVTCTDGTVQMALDFVPRPEYGLVVPLLEVLDGGVIASGGPAELVLSTPVELTLAAGAATGAATLHAGQTLNFALHWAPMGGPAPWVWKPREIAKQLRVTLQAWRGWSRLHQRYEGPWRDLVWQSGRVLQALTYQPTGAILAAATTSLPETVGGARNWDYRFTWIRDASFTMDALWVAACPAEAGKFFRFMTNAAASQLPDHGVQIMYGVGGEHDLTERELAHLTGWRDSRPVRVGNGAWTQTQLDVYGELLATAVRFTDVLDDAGPGLRTFLSGLADTAARAWQEPDNGIWEIRGEPRHYTHSKLLCWLALDRAAVLAHRYGETERARAWRDTRDEIRAAILAHGWSERAGAYAQAFGGDDLDASVLMMPIVGFLPAIDPRMHATIEAISAGLVDRRGLIYRYRAGDGLSGEEGTFLICTFWLAHAYALAGQIDRAQEVFKRAAGYANDIGLLAEQVDPATGALLGNFPQAFSHIGLINAANAIAEAQPVKRGRWHLPLLERSR
jgi:GH15 family glucan-1,4-alpha-glucosidase